MSRASTMSAMGQRLAQSIGIGFAATLLHLFQGHAHATHVTAAIIAPAFLIIGGGGAGLGAVLRRAAGRTPAPS